MQDVILVRAGYRAGPADGGLWPVAIQPDRRARVQGAADQLVIDGLH